MLATIRRGGFRALALSGVFLAAALPPTGAVGAMESTAGASNMTGTSSGAGPSMAHMGSTARPQVMGTHATSMGSMSMTAGAHPTNILPNWLAVLWTLAFLVILVIHGRHILESQGQRRIWHSGHVFMALGMAFMYAPASIDHFNIPTGFWSLAFANGAIAIVLWTMVQAFAGRGTNLLWLLLALDLGAMAYMWSPSGFQAPVTWLLVAYFAGQAVLWGTDRMRSLDERTILGGAVSVTPEGALVASVAEPLICYKDLRASMAVMTIGMAYMFAAMQLLM